eukprot:1195966-Prorocentrum_minimum.AAC.5
MCIGARLTDGGSAHYCSLQFQGNGDAIRKRSSKLQMDREHAKTIMAGDAACSVPVMNTGLGFDWVSNGLWIHSSTFWSSLVLRPGVPIEREIPARLRDKFQYAKNVATGCTTTLVKKTGDSLGPNGGSSVMNTGLGGQTWGSNLEVPGSNPTFSQSHFQYIGRNVPSRAPHGPCHHEPVYNLGCGMRFVPPLCCCTIWYKNVQFRRGEVGVVYRAQGPALGSWEVQPPAACEHQGNADSDLQERSFNLLPRTSSLPSSPLTTGMVRRACHTLSRTTTRDGEDGVAL